MGWRYDLAIQVARGGGTERAWTGKYNDNKEKGGWAGHLAQWTVANSKIEILGVYECVCCGTALFSSKKKYDSGSGWPSFVDSVRNEEGNDKITRKTDFKFGMRRTEVGISPSFDLTYLHTSGALFLLWCSPWTCFPWWAGSNWTSVVTSLSFSKNLTWRLRSQVLHQQCLP